MGRAALLSVRREFVGQKFGGEEVADGFAAADEVCGGAVDEDFGWAGSSVVVGGLGHAVGSCVEEEYEIVGFDCREGSVPGEEVAGLADRTYYVGCEGGFPCRLFYRDDFVVGMIERGANQVVHGGVGDDESLAAVFFDVEDACEECAGLSYDEASRFEEEV